VLPARALVDVLASVVDFDISVGTVAHISAEVIMTDKKIATNGLEAFVDIFADAVVVDKATCAFVGKTDEDPRHFRGLKIAQRDSSKQSLEHGGHLDIKTSRIRQSLRTFIT